jgi:hypothetical protein
MGRYLRAASLGAALFLLLFAGLLADAVFPRIQRGSR